VTSGQNRGNFLGMLRRSFVLGAVLSTCAISCTDRKDSKSAPALDERLKPGQTRAGMMTRETELVGGDTAKGRVGDYKIYNSKVAVVIAEPGASRGFQPYGGIIIDADRVRPAGEPGKSAFGEVVSALDLQIIESKTVEVVSDGSAGGEARIRFYGEEGPFPLFDTFLGEIFPQQKHDMSWDVDYVLEPDAEYLRIEYTIRNRGREVVDIGLPIAAFMFGDGAKPFMPEYGFTPPSSGGSGEYYGAIGEDVSYLYGRPGSSVAVILSESGIVVSGLGDGFTLKQLERETIVHHLVIGEGDLARSQAIWRRSVKEPPLPLVEGRITDTNGRPVTNARVHIAIDEAGAGTRDYVSMARTDGQGRYAVGLLPGKYRATVAEGRRTSDPRAFTVEEGRSLTGVDVQIGEEGFVVYDIQDDQGRALPVKLSVRSSTGDAVNLPDRYGEEGQNAGLFSTIFAVYGKGRVSLPAGEYQIWISRGAEYEMAERTVSVRPGAETPMQAVLARTMKTQGWMSTDTHVHSQLSPDSPDLFPFKVSAMIAEGLEIPVSTEHEAIGDFNPTIQKMGLGSWMKGIIGSEITTYIYGHFNAFPLIPDPSKPGNGRIEWYKKAPKDTFAAIRAAPGDPFLQVNHPRSPAIGGYLSAMGFDPVSYTFQKEGDFSDNFDALEVANGCTLREIEEVSEDWFAFLNRGKKVFATGATDNHRAGGGDMGLPLTWVRLSTDEPSQLDLDEARAAFKGGRMIVSCGPFVEIKMGDVEIGGTAPMTGDEIAVNVRISATSWMDVDVLEMIVNGRVVKTVEIAASESAERFNGPVTVPVTAGQDAWVIARVRGDRPHGVWARNRPSIAFTNPIFLDGDSNGTWGPGR
jgi:hypothetical protein